MTTVYKWSPIAPENMPEVWNFTCRGYGWTAVPAHCPWPHTRLTHSYQSPVLPEAHYTGVCHWLSKGVECFYPKITKKPIKLSWRTDKCKYIFILHIHVVWVYTLSVALPSMQVWTSRWPSQDTARCRMETGRELSQGGRKQRMYWPRRTVWMITVPSWEKQSRKHVQWSQFFFLCKNEHPGVCSYPRSRHSHVQLCADTDTDHLIYVSIQHLNWFGTESHRGAALVTQGFWEVYVKFTTTWMIWINNKYLLF